MTKLHIVHIYPNEMNTYGDRGNLLTLKRRAEWHGLQPVIHYYDVGGTFPKQVDIMLGGGGQDSAQGAIQDDILRIGNTVHRLVNASVPMLMVCGTYQLFGKRFITNDGQEIKGIEVFDVETLAGPKRLVGNIAIETADFGRLYGFENHSGRTVLGASQASFGTVVRGNGNSGGDTTEGARTRNAVGTYMHGPLLPNNPKLADGLIKLALERMGSTITLRPIDDSFAVLSRKSAAARKY
ncbi:MAG TPA: glutamine amidotransferase [Candidatus Saccharimonadia bacterium]|nr:glutamine amidotransferase [Candidatus Saccharimonadia bacterium]